MYFTSGVQTANLQWFETENKGSRYVTSRSKEEKYELW